MDGPIPGQSLTRTPRNALYERPPEIADPNEAVIWHMKRLSDPKRLDNLLFTLEYGVPVKHATQAALTAAVARGIHSIDVSLIIAPVVHKFISSTAEEAGIKYLDDFEDREQNEQDERAKVRALLEKSVQETPVEERDEGYEMLSEMSESVESMDIEQETQGEVAEELQEVAAAIEKDPQEKPRGLMARG